MEAMFGHLLLRNVDGIFVRHPTGVHRVHVDAVELVVGGRRARHHVERRLGHVGVRVTRCLELAVELAFHRRHVHNVLVAIRRAQHERLEPRIQQERRNRVHQLHLQQLHARHFMHEQAP